ncbi:MAG TPA: hypothetical protein VFP87_05975 [Chitinophagaceae bacterium]|nr:hypothetical protein [Chitinophagaceae bacterium]
MKKILITLVTTATLTVMLDGCYYDVASQLYPAGGTTCDTTKVTYSTTVRTILQTNGCLSCHSGTGAAGGNIVLDNYNSVKVYAQNGQLYGSINRNPGFVPMPQGGNKLSDCDLSKVKVWINAGTLNN